MKSYPITNKIHVHVFVTPLKPLSQVVFRSLNCGYRTILEKFPWCEEKNVAFDIFNSEDPSPKCTSSQSQASQPNTS